jgi:hypothetical protein
MILAKSVARITIPSNEIMEERVYIGLKRIAMDTIPLKLVTESGDGIQVLRKIDSTTYIRYPQRPLIDSGLNIDIDDDLIDALGYFVLAGLEQQRAKQLMGLYHTDIDFYNDKLIQTYLEEASNDSEKFYQFP